MNMLLSRRCGAFACLALLIAMSWSVASAQTVTATGYTSSTIFTAPTVKCGDGTSNCRFDAWLGTWFMQDGSLISAFSIATGPASPAQGRALMPESLLNLFVVEDGTGRKFTHTNPAPSGFYYFDKGRDFYGLNGGCPPSPTLPTAAQKCTEVVYLKSFDGGTSWTTWRTDPYQGLTTVAYNPQATIALPNGTLIRRVNGDDLKWLAPATPETAMLQSLVPSGGVYPTSWPANSSGAGQVVTISADPKICKYQISRIRALNDGTGRYIALGQEWKYVSGTSGTCSATADSDLLLVASSATDVEAGTWSIGMPYVPSTVLSPNEWDAAQIAGGTGDLLGLFRTSVSGASVRRQARLRAASGVNCPAPTNGTIGCWVLDQATLGDPGINLPHSGHPELLATQEGVIIEFADTGAVSYTTDGSSWTTLSGFTGGKTNYYPRSIQDPTTRDIYVFSHKGCDDPYAGLEAKNYTGSSCWVGTGGVGVYQFINMQKFKLVVSGGSPPTVTTTAATGITSSAATLHGTVNPNGLATSYFFQYGTNTSYGTNTTSTSAGSGSTAIAESANISGLAASTLYHFRMVASNTSGTTNGADLSFTTSASGGTSYYQSVLNSNPVSYWRLGEASGTTAADVNGINPGTYKNGVTLGAAGAVPSNTAASFDGANDYVLAPDSASLDTGDIFTAEAWIKRSLLGGSNTIVNKFGSYYFYLDATNKLVLYKTSGGTIAVSTATISDTTSYHHVAVTKSGATVKIYLDGVDVTGTVTNLTVVNSTGGLYIGLVSTGYFHGLIDEVAIYNTALSASTIAAHFAARNN